MIALFVAAGLALADPEPAGFAPGSEPSAEVGAPPTPEAPVWQVPTYPSPPAVRPVKPWAIVIVGLALSPLVAAGAYGAVNGTGIALSRWELREPP